MTFGLTQYDALSSFKGKKLNSKIMTKCHILVCKIISKYQLKLPVFRQQGLCWGPAVSTGERGCLKSIASGEIRYIPLEKFGISLKVERHSHPIIQMLCHQKTTLGGTSAKVDQHRGTRMIPPASCRIRE